MLSRLTHASSALTDSSSRYQSYPRQIQEPRFQKARNARQTREMVPLPLLCYCYCHYFYYYFYHYYHYYHCHPQFNFLSDTLSQHLLLPLLLIFNLLLSAAFFATNKVKLGGMVSSASNPSMQAMSNHLGIDWHTSLLPLFHLLLHPLPCLLPPINHNLSSVTACDHLSNRTTSPDVPKPRGGGI